MKKNLKCINTKKKPMGRTPENISIISKMKDCIKKNSKKIWLPKFTEDFDDVKTSSWFDHQTFTSNVNNKITGRFKSEPKIKSYKRCIKVKLIFNKTQRLIINNWLNACTVVYNKTASLLRTGKFNASSTKLLFEKLQRELVEFKHEVADKALVILRKIPYIGNKFNKKNQVRIHILDKSIKEACKNYKACLTKIKLGQIRFFKLKNLKFNRINKIMHLEKDNFNNNTIFMLALGQVKAKYNGEPFNFNDIKEKYNCDCSLKFDNNRKEYMLFVPTEVNVESERKKKSADAKKMISIDPGLRTFVTGITENSVEKICNNYMETIRPLIEKEEKYVKKKKKKDSNKKLLKKKINSVRKKIENKIDDMHWKTINYLTKNHENIFIGNLSTKDIVKKSTSKLNVMTKKLSLRTNMYKFRERLEYKCGTRGVNYEMIKENYTSKMCSNCGEIKEDLGSKKIFECNNNKCKKKIDRDVNGARNIYLKKYLKK